MTATKGTKPARRKTASSSSDSKRKISMQEEIVCLAFCGSLFYHKIFPLAKRQGCRVVGQFEVSRKGVKSAAD